MVDPRIIVAFDFSNQKQALELAAKLDKDLCRIKIGKELFTAAGPQLVEKLMVSGYEIFLDLKYHDIPNTVASACKVASDLGVWMVNIHALGGRKNAYCRTRSAHYQNDQTDRRNAINQPG